MPAAYDDSSITSIVEYARHLVGSTLREQTHLQHIDNIHRRKGSFGNALEKYYFEYDINSSPHPDFEKVGLELKTTPVKRNRNGSYSAKERLVFSMIDYMTVVNEDFEHSSFLKKASKVLLITYEWQPHVDPLDYKIVLASLWGLPDRDMPQFKQDWETIVNKIRDGHAEDISSSDTMYLEACTKASNAKVRRRQPFSAAMAKPRAWALKASYMTTVDDQLLVMQPIRRSGSEREMPFIDLVRCRFSPYFGLTEDELAARLGIPLGKRRPKNLTDMIARRILGVGDKTRIEEFEKAGIWTKSVRLQRNGRPKEAMSFPTFKYEDIVKRPFEESAFLTYLQRKYLFVIYEENDRGEYELADVCLWQMPDSDIPEAKRCYDQMRRNVQEGRAEDSVLSSENRCCHVRPHAQRKSDTYPQPYGKPVTKKCFWLNQDYLRGEIARARMERTC